MESWDKFHVGLVLRHRLRCVWLVGLTCLSLIRCKEVKILKVMTICYVLENLSSIHVLNIAIEYDLFRGHESIEWWYPWFDWSLSFVIVKAKDASSDFEVIFFSHVRLSKNTLAQCVVQKAFGDSCIFNVAWFSCIVNRLCCFSF